MARWVGGWGSELYTCKVTWMVQLPVLLYDKSVLGLSAVADHNQTVSNTNVTSHG